MSMMQRELKINAYQASERERKVKQKTAHYYYKLSGNYDNYVLNEIRSRLSPRTQLSTCTFIMFDVILPFVVNYHQTHPTCGTEIFVASQCIAVF